MALLARKFGFALLEQGAKSVSLKNFTYYDRMLPAQDSLLQGGLGNLIALPLQGKAIKEGNSAFVDKEWKAYPNQWEILFQTKRLSKRLLEERIREWGIEETPSKKGIETAAEEKERGIPWENGRKFLGEDIQGSLKIVLSNLIYVDALHLKPRLQNQIRRLAAFGNPAFYKNQAMGLSNFRQSRFIYLGQDQDGYIGIPRGLREQIKSCCREAGISVEERDLREKGRMIHVTFKGLLRENQKLAVERLGEYDCGILSAATAFGKTVVGTGLIAEKKVNTLILLESSALMEQWEEALKRFLLIEEEPPEYRTPSGRVKRRKSVIGKLQGAHDSTTGIIDIAMAGSLNKKAGFHPRLSDYGMILVDECHHAASNTVMEILKEAKARYVYGVTATPVRGDGLEKVNYMLIGPIRYRYTAKEMAAEQGMGHLVYPRFTRAVPIQGEEETLHISRAYEMIKDSSLRNEMIVKDVRQCIQDGRCPVVLTRHKDHAKLLFNRLEGCAEHVLLLLGGASRKEQREFRARLGQIPPNASLVLIATGQLIGEGFDFPRLDTLIMAAPVSGRGVLEQYAGRLNRSYEGKDMAVIFDYVDRNFPVFDRMYSKRLRTYRQIGYSVCAWAEATKQEANAIFDKETYGNVFERDLLEARKEIVVSSPKINRDKVRYFLECV